MSVVQRALQPALQPPMHPPLQSQLHSQLEMQSYVLGQALQSVGNRASLPALKPTGQSAADSPKGSRQVLAHVPGHLQPFGSTFERVEHKGCSGNRFAKDCVS